MHWILILYSGSYGFSVPIEMASQNVCMTAAKGVDDKTGGVWAFCINRDTGEVLRNEQ